MFDIRDISIHHERDQVKNEVSTLAKDCECGEAKVLESGIMSRSRPTHSVYHFFAHFHWRRKWFGVATQNVAKIN